MTQKFVTAINCIDGRTQEPVIAYAKAQFGAHCVDMITEPGPSKVLSKHPNKDLIALLKEKAKISIEQHRSDTLLLIAHANCAGNPVSEEQQKEELHEAVSYVASWKLPFERILALWLDPDFNVHVVLEKVLPSSSSKKGAL